VASSGQTNVSKEFLSACRDAATQSTECREENRLLRERVELLEQRLQSEKTRADLYKERSDNLKKSLDAAIKGQASTDQALADQKKLSLIQEKEILELKGQVRSLKRQRTWFGIGGLVVGLWGGYKVGVTRRF
jgi:hypothetical protein